MDVTKPDLGELAAIALAAAKSAGVLLLDSVGASRTTIETKTSRTDMVTEMDRASEALVASMIRAARPDDGFLGEEGTTDAGTSGVRWVVDPLDGTTNYLYRYPAWAVSIAAEVDGRTVVGVVHHPGGGETFTAVVGEGARCNGRPLGVQGAPDLSDALLGTGFSYEAANRAVQGDELAFVLPRVRDIRRSGSAALDICWLADSRLDAFFERGLQPWDWAAAALIASEAGASCARMDDGTHVAAAPQLFDELCEMLVRARGRAASRDP